MLQPLPTGATCDYEEVVVTVTSSGGFTLRKVFYTVPSRLIGHRLRVRLYDDRLEFFSAAPSDDAAARARPCANGKHAMSSTTATSSMRCGASPMALLSLVYRDQLFPREAYRRTFDALRETPAGAAGLHAHGRLLALAHERAARPNWPPCSTSASQPGDCPDLDALRARFAPDPARLPQVVDATSRRSGLRGPDSATPDRGDAA